jgi:hypothetical protein
MLWKGCTATAVTTKVDWAAFSLAEFKMQKHVWLQLLCMAMTAGILAVSASQSDEISEGMLLVSMTPFFVFAVYVFTVME